MTGLREKLLVAVLHAVTESLVMREHMEMLQSRRK